MNNFNDTKLESFRSNIIVPTLQRHLRLNGKITFSTFAFFLHKINWNDTYEAHNLVLNTLMSRQIRITAYKTYFAEQHS